MMTVFDLTGTNLSATFMESSVVFVEYWAAWCGACRLFAPVYEAAADRNTDIVFGRVDIEDQPGLAADAGVSSVPALVAFREGSPVWRYSGGLPPKALELVISGIREMNTTE